MRPMRLPLAGIKFHDKVRDAFSIRSNRVPELSHASSKPAALPRRAATRLPRHLCLVERAIGRLRRASPCEIRAARVYLFACPRCPALSAARAGEHQSLSQSRQNGDAVVVLVETERS